MAVPWMKILILSVLLVLPATAQDQGCQTKADICFLLDDSGSIRDSNPIDKSYDNWKLLLDFVQQVINKFDIGQDNVQVGVVKFSDNATLVIPQNRFRNKDALKNDVSRLSYDGGFTDTYKGLKALQDRCFSRAYGDREKVRNIAIVITDGVPTRNMNLWQAEAARLKQDVTVFAVGVTNLIDTDTLNTIASSLRDVKTVFSVSDFRSLETVLDVLGDEACQVHIDACNGLADLVFVMDVSSSITWNDPMNWERLKNFVEYVSRAFPVSLTQTRIGVIRFSDTAVEEFPLNRYTSNAAVSRAISRMTHTGGETNIAGALNLLWTSAFTAAKGGRSGVKNIAILITDGTANINPTQVSDQAQRARGAGIEIFTVGITNDTNSAELQSIANQPSSTHVFRTDDFKGLLGILNNVIRESCRVSDPLPGFSTTPSPFTTTRSTPTDCTSQADICFLIDSSGSIRDNNPKDGAYDNWDLLLTFVRNIIESFPIGQNDTRVGAVKFSNKAHLQFHLDTYYNKQEMLSAVSNIKYSGGYTNTSGGLKVMREECFNTRQGDRFDVPNIAIVITDGVPTLEENKTLPEAEKVKQQGIFVFAIGITSHVNDTLLKNLSTAPSIENEQWFSSPDFTELDKFLDKVVNKACEAPTLPPACPARGDIVFILDASGSITFSDPRNWNRMLEFIQYITNGFPIALDRTRHGLILFSSNATVAFDLDDHPTGASVREAISKLQHTGGETNITGALRLARTVLFTEPYGDRPDIDNFIILITDGQSNVEKTGVEQEAAQLKRQGVEIFVVGITDEVDRNELRTIASPTAEMHVFEVSQFSLLMSILRDVIEKTCAAVPTYIPGPTTSTIRPPTTTSPSTTPRPPVPGCDNTDADVVFILDTSGSIGSRNFVQVQKFVMNIIKNLNIEGGRIRLGVLTFSDSPRLEFNMNKFRSRTEMENAVQTVYYTRGTTNTAAALRYARNNMFRQSAGDRDNARNMIMIITDGESNNAEETMKESRLTKQAGIHLVSVGVGGWLDLHELKAMASYPTKDNMIHVTDFNSFDPVVELIRSAICGGGQCNRNPCQNGQCLDMIGGYICQCRPGYGGRDCDLRCSVPADVVFVLDNSGSVRRNNFVKMVDFVTEAVERMDIDNGQRSSSGTRVGLVSFANDVQPQFNLNEYRTREDILNAINVRYTGGTTNTAAAIRYVRDTMFTPAAGDRPGVANIVVILTDGRSNNPDDTWQQALDARKEGITVVAVGIGGGTSERELDAMASDPVSGNVMNVANFDSLNTILNKLTNGMCHNELLCRSNPCRNGARCTDLIFGFTCGPCPQGFTGFLCERRCSGVADVAFVIDASGSIRRERFPQVIDFVTSVVQQLDVNPTRTRVGAIYWSDNAVVEFDLDDYTTRQDVEQALYRMPFMGGRTHTSAGLRMLRENVFIPSAGDRETVPNYAIVITDGNSNINPEDTIPEAIQARIAGAHIIVISVGTDLNMVELEGIASQPKSANLHAVTSIKTLPDILSQIINSFCDDVDECTSNPCANGGQCVNGLSRYLCICGAGNTGYNCGRSCSRQLDVTLLLDLSGSVEDRYRMIVEFARRVVYGLDMQFDRARVAVVAFSTDIIDRFYLNTYQNKEAVINALNFYHKGGRTNIPEALRVMRQDIFSQSRGDRAGVRNVGILVSDGYANINEANFLPEAAAARRANIELFAVAVGDNSNLADMNQAASDPDSEHVYQVQTMADVTPAADKLLDFLCQ